VSFDSATLAEIVTESIKESDNLISRHMFLSFNQSLGKKNYKTSRKIMKKVLRNNGIKITNSTFIENGSGLSRKTKIRPETILDLLQAMKQHSSSDILLNSLPVSGVDGSLENKYQTDLLKKRLKLKTGTLDGVSGLAGFITGLSGKDYIFVFIHNDIPDYSYRISPFREALLNWVVDDIN
jgi:D-alanyl-D-alanine carboxypeptidase/D-alanyl-D-alanine-endopeptidase (penicillin-binding protein 4)